MNESKVEIQPNQIDSSVRFQDTILLTYSIQYPNTQAPAYPESAACINRYYETETLLYQDYLLRELFHQAADHYQYSIPGGNPVNAYEAVSRYQITLNASPLLSLYTDRYEYTGGAHGMTVRRSETWCLPQCRRLQLSELFPDGFDYRSYLLAQIAAQIEKAPELYFDNPNQNIAVHFQDDHFYCVPGGLVIYYQQYEIAPYSAGIREFEIPYPAGVTPAC